MGVTDMIANLRINTSDFVSGLNDAAGRVESFGYNLRRTLNTANASGITRSYQDIVTVADQFGISMDQARRRLGLTRGEYRELIEQHRRLNAEAERSRFAFKDIARIIGGIIVAKVFYSGMQAIRSATDAVWEFSKAVEYADITFTNLFGNADLSKEFINVLQDFAAETVFSFEDAEAAARRLLSYGIQYKNVMYVMEGVMAGATVTGNSQNIERISRALGQIYTKGRLMGEEMRQLAEAGVPAYDILIEKLGLTQKQLQNLGKQSIPASKAINALVDGITERFGNVVNAAALTTTGLINKAKDNALILANGIFEPVLNKMKSFIGHWANWLNELRLVYNKSGTGGVLEAIVPDHLHTTYRTFIANAINLTRAFKDELRTLGIIGAQIGHILVSSFNVLAPILTTANHVLSAFVSHIFGTRISVNILGLALTATAAALVLFLGNLARVGIVKLFTNAINILSKALIWLGTILTRHPVIFFLSLLAVGVAGVAASNTKLGNSLRNLMKEFSSLGGMDPGKTLLPETKDRAADVNKFNEEFDKTKDAIDGAADSTDKLGKKAAKASKQLLSFDEVFKLNDPDEDKGSGSGAADAIDDIIDGLGAGLGGMEVPSLTDYADKFVNSLSEALMAAIGRLASGGSNGALIGALVGFAIGGLVTKTMSGALAGAKYGAGIGALIGAGIAVFWADAYKEMEGSLTKIAQAGGAGALIGGLVGLVIGAFATKDLKSAMYAAGKGAAIGGLIGAGIGAFWAAATEEMNSSLEALMVGGSIGALVGGLVGMVIGAFASPAGQRLKGALTGALYGASIGSLIAGGVATVWATAQEGLSQAMENVMGAAGGGAVIGSLVGFILGAYLGTPGSRLKSAIQWAMIGSSIGALAAGGLQLLWDTLRNDMAGIIEGIGAGAGIGALVGGLIGLVVGAFAATPGTRLKGALTGAQIGAGLGAMIGAGLAGFWESATNDMNTQIENLAIGSSIGMVIGGLLGMIIGAFASPVGSRFTGALTGAKIGAGIGALAGGALGTFWNDMTEEMRKLIENLGKGAMSGTLIGAALGFLIGGFSTGTLSGAFTAAKWGATIGAVLGTTTGWLKTYFGDTEKSLADIIARIGAGAAFSSLVGAALGFVLGGFMTGNLKGAFAAAKWGATIGAVVGTAEGYLKQFFPETEKKIGSIIANLGKDASYGALIGAGLGFLLGAVATRDIKGAFAASKWGASIGAVLGVTNSALGEFFDGTENSVGGFLKNLFSGISAAATGAFIGGVLGMIIGAIIGVFAGGIGAIPGARLGAKLGAAMGGFAGLIADWWKKEDISGTISKSWGNLWDTSKWAKGWEKVSKWFTDLFDSIKNWFTDIGKSIANWWNSLWSDKEASVTTDDGKTKTVKPTVKGGHATGGIFNKEHIARFAEGNKAEAVIPLENASAMKPFVDAVSQGLTQSLMPVVASITGGSIGAGSNLPPMYVGALIADERGLRELNKKMQLIQLQEDARKGLA